MNKHPTQGHNNLDLIEGIYPILNLEALFHLFASNFRIDCYYRIEWDFFLVSNREAGYYIFGIITFFTRYIEHN